MSDPALPVPLPPLPSSQGPAPAPGDDFVGRLVGGRYRVQERVGQGGMGAVFQAVQEPFGRPVALKVLRRDVADADGFLERFRRETRVLAGLSHPNLVSLLDAGEDPSFAWIAMELVGGVTLRRCMSTPLPAADALTIAADIACGLGAAHERGVVHRDLKPENVMITRAFGRPRIAKLLDFGIARVTDDPGGALTRTGFMVGTPGYIAPEVAKGVLDDPRSDLYALGVVLWEMLAGRPPYTAEAPMLLVVQHMQEPLPSPASQIPQITPQLGELLLRLLAKSPSHRFKDAAAVLDAIEVALRATPGALERPTESMAFPPDPTVPGLRRPRPSPAPLLSSPLPEANRRPPTDPTTGLPGDARPLFELGEPLPEALAAAPSSSSSRAPPVRDAPPTPASLSSMELPQPPLPSSRPLRAAALALGVAVIVGGGLVFAQRDLVWGDEARCQQGDVEACARIQALATSATPTVTPPPSLPVDPADAPETPPVVAAEALRGAPVVEEVPVRADEPQDQPKKRRRGRGRDDERSDRTKDATSEPPAALEPQVAPEPAPPEPEPKPLPKDHVPELLP